MGRTSLTHRVRTGVVIFFLTVSVLAGIAFVVKFVEFFASIEDPDILGFAVAPLVNYAFVAAGFLCLLIWAFLSGQLSDVEKTKGDIIDEQEQLDREDPHLHPGRKEAMP